MSRMTVFKLTASLLWILVPTCCGQMRSSLTPPWPGPYWDIPGYYCEGQFPHLQCCPGRQDRCSVPIFGTLCYCDTFCNRTKNSDCCPDYFSHCEGLSHTKLYYQEAPAPAELMRPPQDCEHGVLNISNPMCVYHGRSLSGRETLMDNCNQCNCQVSRTKPGCMEVTCSTHKCILEEDVITELKEGERRSLYTWTPSNFSDFWGKSLEEGKMGKLGAERPGIPIRYISAIHFFYSPSTLPQMFDAMSTWPGLMTPVIDQGWCSSSSALSTTAVVGDRMAVAEGRAFLLSPGPLIPCVGSCNGGDVGRAWQHLRRHGAYEQACDLDTSTCLAIGHTNCTRYRTKPAYRVGRENNAVHPTRKEEDIMYEVMSNGPVQTIIAVYTDFFMYGSGVYQRTNLASSMVVGYHAVRIVGWGEERGVKYWRVANSWGKEWGEEGFFKIKKGENECLIEEFVVGVWPRPQKRRARRRRNRQNRMETIGG